MSDWRSRNLPCRNLSVPTTESFVRLCLITETPVRNWTELFLPWRCFLRVKTSFRTANSGATWKHMGVTATDYFRCGPVFIRFAGSRIARPRLRFRRPRIASWFADFPCRASLRHIVFRVSGTKTERLGAWGYDTP